MRDPRVGPCPLPPRLPVRRHGPAGRNLHRRAPDRRPRRGLPHRAASCGIVPRVPPGTSQAVARRSASALVVRQTPNLPTSRARSCWSPRSVLRWMSRRPADGRHGAVPGRGVRVGPREPGGHARRRGRLRDRGVLDGRDRWRLEVSRRPRGPAAPGPADRRGPRAGDGRRARHRRPELAVRARSTSSSIAAAALLLPFGGGLLAAVAGGALYAADVLWLRPGGSTLGLSLQVGVFAGRRPGRGLRRARACGRPAPAASGSPRRSPGRGSRRPTSCATSAAASSPSTARDGCSTRTPPPRPCCTSTSTPHSADPCSTTCRAVAPRARGRAAPRRGATACARRARRAQCGAVTATVQIGVTTTVSERTGDGQARHGAGAPRSSPTSRRASGSRRCTCAPSGWRPSPS